MGNLIDGQAAIEAIYEEFDYAYCDNCDNNDKPFDYDNNPCEDCHRKYQNWAASRKSVERVINGLPSVKQKTGKWIHCTKVDIPERKYFIWFCSECGHGYDDEIMSIYDFCPTCGAKMVGVDYDEEESD